MDGIASLGHVGAAPRYVETSRSRASQSSEATAPKGAAAAALLLIRSALVLEQFVGRELDVRA